VSTLHGRALDLKHAGNRAIAKRDLNVAEGAFRELIKVAPESAEGYLGLARTLERAHRHDEIVEVLEPVVEHLKTPGITKAVADAYRVLANRGNALAALHAIRYYEAYRKTRNDPVSLYYLGELYREHVKDYERALDALKESLKSDPTSPTVLAAAIASAQRLGRDDEVEELRRIHKPRT
jgi:tetratricopeptide (TPR) repeat protein